MKPSLKIIITAIVALMPLLSRAQEAFSEEVLADLAAWIEKVSR